MTTTPQEDEELQVLVAPLLSPTHPKIMHISEQNFNILNSTQVSLNQDVRNIQHTLLSRDIFITTLFFLVPFLLLAYFSRHAIKNAVQRFREKSVPQVDPKKVAIDEINKLNKRPANQETIKDNTIQLTEILREYLEKQVKLKAKEKTTEEFLAELVTHPSLSKESRDQLKKILTETDLVKFAQLVPSVEQYQQTLSSTEEFISKN